jgi:hypothetical protein
MTVHFSRYLAHGSEVAAQTERGANLLASIQRDGSMAARISALKNVIANTRTQRSGSHVPPAVIREVIAASLLT